MGSKPSAAKGLGLKGPRSKPPAAPQAQKPRASKVKGGVTYGVFAAVQAAAIAVASGKPGDAALVRAIRDQGLPPREGRRAHSFADQIFRHWARLGWIWTSAKGEPGGRERTLLGLRLFLGTPTSEIAALLRGQETAERLSPVEANALDRVPLSAMSDTALPRLAQLECPEPFAEPLRRSLGDRFEAELEAMRELPPVSLRINTLRTTRDAVFAEFNGSGMPVELCQTAPHGMKTVRGADIGASAAFLRGDVEFQDEGSQLVAHLVGARSGMQVLDLCAGAGGKSLAMAADMKNKGHLVAADTHTVRVARAKQRFKRAGVENAECVVLEPKWLKAKRGRFDRVLVDAPCTGTGAWGRNPDQRWTLDADALGRLIAEQDALLDTAAQMVKPGGAIVYATCSLLLEENEDRIRAFRLRHPAFELAPAWRVWSDLGLPAWPSTDREYFRVSPARNGMDGFFAAVLQRPSLAARPD
jgi:16S rRNA (cytosine967-C5)-methyltransferase